MVILLFTLCFSLFPFTSHAGIFTNGGGYSADIDNVWFLGDEPVEYCVVAAGDYPVGIDEARKVVRESLDEWIAFFRTQGISALKFRDLALHDPAGISLDFKEVPECSAKRGQLKFLLGVRTREVRKLMESRRLTLGLAFRDAFNHATLRNGGSIYIQDWSLDRARLKHLVLHELGHILGMTHNSLPIMLEFPADSFLDSNPLQKVMGMIEAPTWRYRLRDGDVIPFSDRPETNLKLPLSGSLFGFAATGRHRLTLQVQQDIPGEWTLSLKAVEEGSGKSAVMTGSFEIRKAFTPGLCGNSGPALFTNWISLDAEQGIFERRQLDSRPRNLEADGAFFYQGRAYPAVLEARPGVMLRIYLPETGQWWNVQDYNGVAIWSAVRQLSQ